MATVKSQEMHGTSIKYDLLVSNVWRQPAVNGKEWPERTMKGERLLYAWVQVPDPSCLCPSLDLGAVYIFLAKSNKENVNELRLGGRNGSAIPYNANVVSRLERFQANLRENGFEATCGKVLRNLSVLARRRRRTRINRTNSTVQTSGMLSMRQRQPRNLGHWFQQVRH
ncbi:hypothetical protein Ciccas_014329 [Cichlidogyrus casuarinus]|uniref:Uncharacterized protein n=1 Tax=Cichlidogyrus casuarinus TaxID=1844966 RepID=A0ABD2PJ47_9PLAT